jgi:hypothetical protein
MDKNCVRGAPSHPTHWARLMAVKFKEPLLPAYAGLKFKGLKKYKED